MNTTTIPATKITTPIGTAKYPWLNDPDTRFNPDGEYRVELVVSAEDGAPLRESMISMRDKAMAEYKKAGGGKGVKACAAFPVVENEDGTFSIKAKLKAKVATKSGRSWEQRPILFDSRGTPIKGDVRIGSGSRLRLSVEAAPFNAPAIGVGLTLRLRGVQVIEVREPRSNSATDFGFGAEETGFVSETFDNFEDDSAKKGAADKKVDF
jgi:hypothetical protein